MRQSFEILSVNISEKKGTIKTPRPEIIVNAMGVENDAHAGDWHRQVSLLAIESIRKIQSQMDRELEFGEFAENITTQSIVLYKTKPGDRLIIGDVELEITQIGKECHGNNCQIFKQVGNCVMPKEGIFAKVLKPGIIKPGVKCELLTNH